MDKFSSILAIKDAIAGETYSGSLDVYVAHNKMVYIYKNIYVKVYYDTAYAQMCVEIVWEDDISQPAYKTIGLHGIYNTNFQQFTYTSSEPLYVSPAIASLIANIELNLSI